jgi:ATP/ADP translocase
MIAHQVGGKATRDALFLSNFEVTSLPSMIIAAALLSIVVVLMATRAMSRLGPARLIPIAFVGSALLTLVEWLIVVQNPRIGAVVVYLHIASFGAVLISGFWSMVTEHFDPRTAKKRISRIAAGGTVGGLIGGLAAERMAAYFDVELMLPVLAIAHLSCGLFVRPLKPLQRPAAVRNSDVEGDDDAAAATKRSSLRILSEVTYLRDLGLLVLLSTVGATLIDYVFKAQATATIGSGPNLLRFFAVFYTAVALITFLVQTTFGRRALEKLGLARTVSSLPAVVAVGSLGATLIPGLPIGVRALFHPDPPQREASHKVDHRRRIRPLG